jgi:phosphosulfolactate synthase (CoM biosynthesis protein A)
LKAFEFVKIEELKGKPRSEGITEIRGSYYTVVTPKYLEELLNIAGEYIDIFKYSGGSMRLHPREKVKQVNSLCHDNGVLVSTGGFTEKVLTQGRNTFSQYLREAKDLGFDIVEISSGYIDISSQEKERIVEDVKEEGLKPKPEVTLVKGAGGAHEEWNTSGLPYDEMMKDIDEYLKCGVWKIMMESEGITENVKEWRKDIVGELIKRYGSNTFVFEAADRPVFRWYVNSFGKDVNLFVDHSQILELTALRTGLWAPAKPWGEIDYK